MTPSTDAAAIARHSAAVENCLYTDGHQEALVEDTLCNKLFRLCIGNELVVLKRHHMRNYIDLTNSNTLRISSVKWKICFSFLCVSNNCSRTDRS